MKGFTTRAGRSLGLWGKNSTSAAPRPNFQGAGTWAGNGQVGPQPYRAQKKHAAPPALGNDYGNPNVAAAQEAMRNAKTKPAPTMSWTASGIPQGMQDFMNHYEQMQRQRNGASGKSGMAAGLQPSFSSQMRPFLESYYGSPYAQSKSSQPPPMNANQQAVANWNAGKSAAPPAKSGVAPNMNGPLPPYQQLTNANRLYQGGTSPIPLGMLQSLQQNPR